MSFSNNPNIYDFHLLHFISDNTTRLDDRLEQGVNNVASGAYSHAEGNSSTALADSAHAEGQGTIALGIGSHAEGYQTTAKGQYSHTSGRHNIAGADHQTVVGKNNIELVDDGAFIIGDGNDTVNRHNLLTAHSGQLSISASSGFTGPVSISGSGLAVNAPASFIGSLGVSGPVAVNGPSAFTGSVHAIGPVGIIGAVSVNGPSAFTGSVQATGPVAVNGASSFTGSVQATGPVGIVGPVAVNGDSSFTGSVQATGPVAVNGPSSFTGSVQATGPVGIVGPVSVNGPSAFTGSVQATGPVEIVGAVSVNGPSAITGSLTVAGNLNVLGSGSFVYVTSSQILIESSSIIINSYSALNRPAAYKVVDLSNAALNSSFEYNPVSQEWTLDKPLNVSLVSKLTADESSLEFSQGAGLNFDASANRTLRIKALGITDAMIAAGTITNAKLVNQSVNYNGVSVALGASGSINLNNSISEGAGIAAFTFNGSGNATVAIDNLGVSNAMLAGGITEDKLFGAIPNGKLANSTISGVALGSNLFDLSVDNSSIEFSAGGPYNGGAAAGIRVKAGGITNAMLLNDGIVVNGVSASLGGSIVVTANLANALSAGSNLTIGAPFDGSAAQTIALSNTLTGLASVSSIAFDGALTGNASTATTLQTPRNINGVAFDGSADISVYAVTYEDLQISDDLHAGIGLTSFNGSLTKTIGIQPGKVTNTMLATPSITINGTAVALGGTRDLSLQDVCTVGNTTTTNINALAFFQTSKREKKKDIVPFEKSALEIIKKTSIVEFKYKDDETNKVHIGFIADDTPVELSTVNQDVMDTNSAIGVLLKAVQELEAKVRELEAK